MIVPAESETGKVPSCHNQLDGYLVNCWRHCDARQNCQRAEDEHDCEIGDLLKCVIVIETVWLRRQMECRAVHPRIPCLQKNHRGRRDDSPSLPSSQQQRDEENAGDDKSVNDDEVPNPRNAHGESVTGCGDDWRYIARIVFCGPNSVLRNV